ncbi:MAG: prepilin-type N-terminal cleavage/methylation domain-containing protein [Planctomycetes bacterium]|nr:prepilin-type N-terminal cleavage/methylation domain-containing protein [Planctomycetota bacterium]
MTRARPSGFTLVELMVSIGILLVLGVMVIGFLRGALTMSRTGTSRGRAYETAQTVLRLAAKDFSQVVGEPGHPDAPTDDLAFVVMQDPWGRQLIAFTRAFGEQGGSLAGYDAARAAPTQGYGSDYTGRNVNSSLRGTHGNLEVVWMLEPSRAGTRLYRAERSPPQAGGLIDLMLAWVQRYPTSDRDDLVPSAALRETMLGGEPLWDQFELVAENVLAFNVECWDDWQGRTATWDGGPTGPVTTWSISQRLQQGKYALPRAIRLTLIVAPEDPIRAESTLQANISRSDGFAPLESTANFPDVTSGSAYIRVNGELMAYGTRASGTLGALARGALGSRAQDHEAGSTVLAGEAFQRVIQFPVSR